MTHANDNDPKSQWKHCSTIGMCAYGAIGFLKNGGFIYLDPKIREWRG